MTLESRTFSYETALEWEGGRRCRVTSGDRPVLAVTPPGEFPGGGQGDWSPEHLYLASLQSCTMLSFLAHCAHNGVEVVAYTSGATGEIARREDDRRYAFKRVSVQVDARVAGGHSELATSLTPKAERDCFITASTSAEVVVEWRIAE
jgi:organic hydroperoxide reductase OsmC/OhrA